MQRSLRKKTLNYSPNLIDEKTHQRGLKKTASDAYEVSLFNSSLLVKVNSFADLVHNKRTQRHRNPFGYSK